MLSRSDIERRAERAVARMTDAQICRLAELDPSCIPLALPPELDGDPAALDALREAIGRLCRAHCRLESAAAPTTA